MKAYSIRVFGLVQGVFFRASTREKANELGLKGWCQNEYGGTVLIHVEGEERFLEEMVSWCRKGPRLSQVREIRHFETDPEGHQGFMIRR